MARGPWEQAGRIVERDGVPIECEDCPCESSSGSSGVVLCEACPTDGSRQLKVSIEAATGGGCCDNVAGDYYQDLVPDPVTDISPPDACDVGNACLATENYDGLWCGFPFLSRMVGALYEVPDDPGTFFVKVLIQERASLFSSYLRTYITPTFTLVADCTAGPLTATVCAEQGSKPATCSYPDTLEVSIL